MAPGSCSSRLRAGLTEPSYAPWCGSGRLANGSARSGRFPYSSFATRNSLASPPRAQQAALFAAPVALLLAFALVVQFLALGYRKQQFGTAALVEIELKRNE